MAYFVDKSKIPLKNETLLSGGVELRYVADNYDISFDTLQIKIIDIAIPQADGSIVNDLNSEKYNISLNSIIYNYYYNESSPALGDVDGDGKVEVVVGSDDIYIYCLSGEDGSLKWRYETEGRVESSPVLGDVDGDGEIEIVIGSNDNCVYCLTVGGNGDILWEGMRGDPLYSSRNLLNAQAFWENDAPVVRIVSPQAGGLYDSPVEVRVSVDDEEENVLGVHVWAKKEGGDWEKVAVVVPDGGCATCEWTPAEDGRYWVKAVAVDALGGVSGDATGIVFVGAVVPEVELVEPATGSYEGTVEVVWEVRDADDATVDVYVEYKREGGGDWTEIATSALSTQE
jgi:hypothetical protein